MAGRLQRDLFLNVTADVGNLSNAMKAGRSALMTLGIAANDVKAEVTKALAEMGGNAPAQAKLISQSYTATFNEIKRNMEALKTAPNGASALGIINVAGAAQAAQAAEKTAAALRMSADAASVVAMRDGEASTAARVLAVALETQAQDAATNAVALRKQAVVMAEVASEAKLLGATEGTVTAAHGRMNVSTMMADHVMRSFSDSVAAGQSPVRAFAMELPRVSEALQLYAMSAGEAEGAMGKFATFISGGWGMAIAGGIAVLAPMIASLFEEGDASKEAAKATKEHESALEALIKAEGQAVLSEEEKLKADYRAIEAERMHASVVKETTVALLKQAIAQQSANKETSERQQQFGAHDTGALQAPEIDNKVAGLQDMLAAAERDLAAKTTASRQAGGLYMKSIIDKRSTPEGQIGLKYERQQTAAEKALEKTGDYSAYARATAGIDRNKAADMGALRESKKKGPRAKVDHTVERAANADRAYEQELSAANARLAKATLALADTSEGRYHVEVEELEAAKKSRDAEIDDQVKAHKISDAQASILHSKNAQATKFEEQLSLVKKQSADLQIALTSTEHARQARDTLLQIDLQMADTRERRLAIEKKLLADAQAARRDRLALEANDPARSPADRAQAAADLKTLPAQDAAEQMQKADQFKSPLAAYQDQLKHNLGSMHDSLQNIAIDGLKGIEDGFVGIISGTETVASAFKKMASSIVADLARIAIEKLIVKAIGGGFFADGGEVKGHATGGFITGPGTGRSDSIIARLSNGEFVINAAATARNLPLLTAINDNRLPAFADGGLAGLSYPRLPSAASMRPGSDGNGPVMVHVTLSDDLNARIDNRAAGVAVQVHRAAAPMMLDAAVTGTIAQLRQPRM